MKYVFPLILLIRKKFLRRHIWHSLIIMWRCRFCVYLEKKHRIMCLTLSWYAIKADVAANPRSILSSMKGKYLFYVVMFTLSTAQENFRDNFCWFRARRKYFKGKIWKARGVAFTPDAFRKYLLIPLLLSSTESEKSFCFPGLVVLSTILSWNVKLLEGFLLLLPLSLHLETEEENYFPAWFRFKWFLGCFLPQKENNFHFVDEKVFRKLIHLGSLFVVDV